MRPSAHRKAPYDIITATVDFSDFAASEPIASAEVVAYDRDGNDVSAQIVPGSPSVDGATVSAQLQGGSDGERYAVKFRATLDGGDRREETLWLHVGDTTPVTLEEAKLHLRVDHSHEDGLILDALAAATEWCERFQGRAYTRRTVTEHFDRFRSPIPLAWGPVRSVTAVTYYDPGGAVQTLDPSVYVVHAEDFAPSIRLAPGRSWPQTQGRHNAVCVEYEAGGDPPAAARSAILLLVGHLYAHRETVVTGATATTLAMTLEDLLWPDRRVSL
ncbi:MAG TPA: head-tail connector protein [Arachnia sp.]|nr:head-tail connector protein [Arachnia sp.]